MKANLFYLLALCSTRLTTGTTTMTEQGNPERKTWRAKQGKGKWTMNNNNNNGGMSYKMKKKNVFYNGSMMNGMMGMNYYKGESANVLV